MTCAYVAFLVAATLVVVLLPWIGLAAMITGAALAATANGHLINSSTVMMSALTGRNSLGLNSKIIKMKDPRPLHSKEFLREALTKITNFLSSMGYPHSLSPKFLSGPSGKEFYGLMQFVRSGTIAVTKNEMPITGILEKFNTTNSIS